MPFPAEPNLDGLYNPSRGNTKSREGTYQIIHERPEHRIMAYLKAQGLSHKEIAKRMGLTPQCISIVTRQPWFQSIVVQIIKESGANEVQALITAYTKDAIQVAHDLMMNEDTGERTRAACAFEFIKTAVGSKLRVEHEPAAKTPDQLDQEIAAKRAEIEALETGGRG